MYASPNLFKEKKERMRETKHLYCLVKELPGNRAMNENYNNLHCVCVCVCVVCWAQRIGSNNHNDKLGFNNHNDNDKGSM